MLYWNPIAFSKSMPSKQVISPPVISLLDVVVYWIGSPFTSQMHCNQVTLPVHLAAFSPPIPPKLLEHLSMKNGIGLCNPSKQRRDRIFDRKFPLHCWECTLLLQAVSITAHTPSSVQRLTIGKILSLSDRGSLRRLHSDVPSGNR